jgi:glutamyl-tRNA reductase
MIANPVASPLFGRSLAPVAPFQPEAEPRAAGLFILGATHRSASLAVRERLALNAETEAGLAAELAQVAGLREFVIVSTCNRFELYGVAAHAAVADRVQDALCARQGIAAGEFAQVRLHLTGADAVRHLLEVAVGLDSQMLGETEIFGQLKKAYAAAQARGATGAFLNRLFQKVFQGAKHVRSNTAITVGQVSVANVAVDLALNIFGNLGSTRILLIGAGEIGEKTARAFRSRGAASLTVCSRRLERADALAQELGGATLPFDDRERRLADFDVIVSSTSAAGSILSAAGVTAAMRSRPDRPLFFIDLALPRDVDPAVARIGNAFLYDLDDLARIAEENRVARAAEIDKCRALLETRATALWSQLEPQLTTWKQALAS